MNNRKMIFVAVIGVVFLFAGYNLYSYFQNQAAIAAEEERIAQVRRIEREQIAAEKKAAREAEQARLDAERQAAREAEEQRQKEQSEAREQARIAEEARQAAEEERLIEEKRLGDERRIQKLLARAREIRQYEGIWSDKIEGLLVLSPRYVLDHPEEFITQRFSAQNFGVRERGSVKVLFEDSNPLMLYSAISDDLKVLQALIDIGLDVNSTNKSGVTPLMFAATYNSPEVVEFLIGQGADVSPIAYIEDMNALHFAARYNPNPETAVALVKAGLPLEGKTSKGVTAALLAALENPNMEVVEQLARLGADTSVYDESGADVAHIVEGRFNGRGGSFFSITPEYQKRVLDALR